MLSTLISSFSLKQQVCICFLDSNKREAHPHITARTEHSIVLVVIEKLHKGFSYRRLKECYMTSLHVAGTVSKALSMTVVLTQGDAGPCHISTTTGRQGTAGRQGTGYNKKNE